MPDFAQTGADTANKPNDVIIDSRCIVKFRPADDWKGEYGFDWFREGDYGEVFKNGSRGKTYAFTYTPKDSDGNPLVDPNGNQVQVPVEIKSNSHYKDDKMVGIYGEELTYISSNHSEQRAYKNSIYFANKIFFGNAICHFEKKNNGKWVLKNSSGGVLSYNGVDEEFDYDKNSRRMNSSRHSFTLFNDFGEGKHLGVDPDNYYYSFSQENDKGETINADLYAKKYQTLYIVNIDNNNKIEELIGEYYVPYISLFCLGRNNDFFSSFTDKAQSLLSDSISEEFGVWKAKVKLLIEAKDVDRIKFYCDEGITCEPPEIEIKKDGKPTKDFVLISNESRCFPLVEEKAFVTVKAMNGDNDTNPTIAGRICVVKYPPKKVDIVFVPIPVRLNKGFSIPIFSNLKDYFDLEKEKGYLKKYLSQAQIVPSICFRRIQKEVNLNKIAKLIEAATSGRPQKIDTVTKKDNVFYADGTKVTKGIKLHEEFEKIFEADLDEFEKYLKSAFKVYYIQADGRMLGQNAGNPKSVNNPPKNVIVFNHKDEPITICHELMHRFGLFHSFSNLSPYTIEKFKTSNIMDYPLKEGLKQQTTWKWQWDEIRGFEGIKDISDSHNVYRCIV